MEKWVCNFSLKYSHSFSRFLPPTLSHREWEGERERERERGYLSSKLTAKWTSYHHPFNSKVKNNLKSVGSCSTSRIFFPGDSSFIHFFVLLSFIGGGLNRIFCCIVVNEHCFVRSWLFRVDTTLQLSWRAKILSHCPNSKTRAKHRRSRDLGTLRTTSDGSIGGHVVELWSMDQ